MNLYISTMLRDDREAEGLLSLLDEYGDGNVGLEIFPLCHVEGWFERLEKFSPRLAGHPVSFHEPYYGAEHSKPKGSPEHRKTMDCCERTFERAAELKAGHMVFHLNNGPIGDRRAMLENALENLAETAELARSHGLRLLVENTGVLSLNNVLLSQGEFVGLFDGVGQDCLLDVGHANCNHWNLDTVMRELRGRIRAYHVHNNLGIKDDHNRMFDGTLNVERFFDSRQLWTPDADVVIEYRPDLFDDGVEWLKDDIAYVGERIGIRAGYLQASAGV